MEEKKETKVEKKKGFLCSIGWLIKKCIVIFVPGFIAAIILFVIINAVLVPTSKPEFCGEKCHEMEKVYASWKKGKHAYNRTGIQVACIECHLPPRDEFFNHLTAKTIAGTKDAIKHLANAEYDEKALLEKVRKKMTNDVCLRCHSKLKDNPFNKDVAEYHNEVVFKPAEGEKPAPCIECHAEAAHVKSNE